MLLTILYSIIILKFDGKHPCDFSLKDENHRNSLRLTSWNQPISNSEIDLFTDSHSGTIVNKTYLFFFAYICMCTYNQQAS